MGVLQDFERRLEGAVEGFFARAFRSGLQPVELAKALQRYAEDNQQVTAEGVVVPNVYRVSVSTRDHERLEVYGPSLTRELAGVVQRTADERGWALRGPARVRVDADPDVKFGMYAIAGRVEASDRQAPEPQPRPLELRPTAHLRLPGGEVVALRGSRLTAGRLASCDVVLDDPTVSREHAAFVHRGDEWWVVDLGSTNGTRVEGVTAAEHPLRAGDRVELGEAELTFEEG